MHLALLVEVKEKQYLQNTMHMCIISITNNIPNKKLSLIIKNYNL